MKEDNLRQHSEALIQIALQEDIATGDITTQYFIPANRRAEATIIAKEPLRLAGLAVAAEVFRQFDSSLILAPLAQEGDLLEKGQKALRIAGPLRSILTAERVALNFLQRLSGIATLTAQYVAAVAATPAQILDTRKTTPGWRHLEKAAVRAGGGHNHRMGLYDQVMVKDNHLALCGEIEHLQRGIEALRQKHPGVKVELEADTLEQVAQFVELDGVDFILLDNMDAPTIARALKLRRGAIQFEASGGITLENVATIAATGVDYISIGALTHSAVAVDFSLEISAP